FVDRQVDTGEDGARLLLPAQCLGDPGELDQGSHVVPGCGAPCLPLPSPPVGGVGRLGPGTATVSSPVSPDLISTTLPSVKPSTTSRVSRVPSGFTTSTLPLPCVPATASTGSTRALAARSVTRLTVTVAPLISRT